MKPIVWTIAGSDSGGGAGIQADLHTFQDFHVHGCSVITSVTAQNSHEVSRVLLIEEAMVQSQLQSLEADLPAKSIKIGMIGSIGLMRLIGEFLKKFKGTIIVDPVMISTSGHALMNADAKATLIEYIVPHADILTPNIHEAKILLGLSSDDSIDIEQAAKTISSMGAKSVLIKGGHLKNARSSDYYYDGKKGMWLTCPRYKTTNTHGSGCTLSSAITASTALGYSMQDALVIGKSYVTQGIRTAVKYGSGPGPVAHLGWANNIIDFPTVSLFQVVHDIQKDFLPYDVNAMHAVCPIVDSSIWVARMFKAGIKTVQLRIKSNDIHHLKSEIEKSQRSAEHFGANLIVNDHWKLAVENQVYGVHLGQDDIVGAEVDAIRNAGLCLGISVASVTEFAIAHRYRPSYIGVGPVFHSTNKPELLPIEPNVLAYILKMSCYPVIALGGITLEKVPHLKKIGIQNIAIVSAILDADKPEEVAKEFLRHFTSPITFRSRYDEPEILSDSILGDLEKIKKTAPLVHNVTNLVVMQQTANALLALGASPIMAHALEELGDLAKITSALVINIGTLDSNYVKSASAAMVLAKQNNKPIIFDPVGVGATAYRTETAISLLNNVSPTVIRGNASEIMGLAGVKVATKGVDSANTSKQAINAAKELVKRYQCVVVVSGKRDYIVAANNICYLDNGVSLMSKVTGMGCTATAILAAFCAVQANIFEAARNAMAVMGISGELAFEHAKLPGSFKTHFIDAIFVIKADDLTSRLRCCSFGTRHTISYSIWSQEGPQSKEDDRYDVGATISG